MSHRHSALSNLINFRYEKVLVKSGYAFEFVKPIKLFAIGCISDIMRYVHIPPRAVVIYSVPRVEIDSIGS